MRKGVLLYRVFPFFFIVGCVFFEFPLFSEENETSAVKEFPHDLYNKEKDSGEKFSESGAKSKEVSDDAIRIKEININIKIEGNGKEKKDTSDKTDQNREYKLPPEDVSRNAENLLWYYLERWINDDYKAMYGALTEDAKRKYSFKRFYDIYLKDRDIKGGLEFARLMGELKKKGPYIEVWVELNYRNENLKPAKVLAVLQYTSEGYRIKDCGLIPIDYKGY
ncbi:MAG: hypothetical protein N3G21_04070 [Candidatus Hydrogenedentes bacterium]|nr:hypothetical protein [Candidatus Hydrogenedentota bacterium]